MLALLSAALLSSALTSCFNDDFDTTNSEMIKSSPAAELRHIINPDSEVRGVWIASVYNIDYPSRTDLSAEELKAELDSILDTCEKNKLNTVFFQVRPSCDALYDSDIFPVSEYISTNGELVFDPLDYLVKEAHQRNIFVHAWVNPLRVTMNTHDLEELDDKSPAKQHPEWTVPYDDGKLYLNAGIPEVCSLIVDGVREIVLNYDVDGIVFDDYFYPYPVYDDSGKRIEFDDGEEYEKYGTEYDSIADWRRANINNIIKSVWEAVHEADNECVFGVSPFAIWQNNNGENGGSDTNGFEGYNSLYCDALAWIEGGYIDYISPQIYWTFDNTSSAFDVLTRWWNTQLDGSDVKLYVSHAAYRYEDGNWENPAGQLSEQVSFARSEKVYRGSIFYGYDEINRNIGGASDDIISVYQDEIIYTEIQSNAQGIKITSPASGSVMDSNKTYILGSSDPYYTLTMNGEKVGRTKSGLFSLYVTLEEGKNVFVFEQNGDILEYSLTYKTDTAEITQKEEEALSLDHLSAVNTYPTKAVATKEDALFVSCIAPADSTVTVNIGGVETELEAAEVKKWASSGYTGVYYSGNASLPIAEDGEIVNCGNIVYNISHRDGQAEAEGTSVRVMGEDSYITVRALEDYTELKITENSSYYNDYTVQSAGMTDIAVSQANGFYKLRMGGYISENDIEELGVTSDNVLSTISKAEVRNSGKTTDFIISCGGSPAYNGCIDETGRFVVTYYSIEGESAPEVDISKNPMVKSCEVVRLENKVRYSFELYAVENFYGFDLSYGENTVVLSLRNPIVIDSDTDAPLNGINIILDAGHGGDDRGAAGADENEKELNLLVTLAAAERLEMLGAKVELTRNDDSTIDLYKRMAFLEEREPDLCVSVHQNSMDFTSDITKVRGTLALWCMDSGAMLADSIGSAVSASLGRYYRGSQYQSLAICRNPKFPQALIELGFITSVEESEQLKSQDGIGKAADGICRGILDWFEKQAYYAKITSA